MVALGGKGWIVDVLDVRSQEPAGEQVDGALGFERALRVFQPTVE